MKSIRTLLLLSTLALGLSAHAITYNVNDLGVYLGAGSGNNDPGPNGTVGGQPFYYKKGESAGAGAGLLTTTLSDDKRTATLEFLSDHEVGDPFYLVLKAGPNWVYWDISSFDPNQHDRITVFNDKLLAPNGKGRDIGHISLYGNSHPLPDNGVTLLLLGTAVACTGAARRRLA